MKINQHTAEQIMKILEQSAKADQTVRQSAASMAVPRTLFIAGATPRAKSWLGWLPFSTVGDRCRGDDRTEGRLDDTHDCVRWMIQVVPACSCWGEFTESGGTCVSSVVIAAEIALHVLVL